MPDITISIPSAPNETAYDVDHPTRSTELYSNSVHNILQDMDDKGSWILTDGRLGTGPRATLVGYLFTLQEDVFDYAEQAIQEHRAEEEITITKPTSTTLTVPATLLIKEFEFIGINAWNTANKMLWLIYYMWKTEEDPLLLKEKLQELLVAWPLLDTTIELADDLGQQFKIYPSWKNADL